MNTRNIMLVLIAVILLVGSLVGYGLYVNVTSSAHVDKLAAAQYSRVIGAKRPTATSRRCWKSLHCTCSLPGCWM